MYTYIYIYMNDTYYTNDTKYVIYYYAMIISL